MNSESRKSVLKHYDCDIICLTETHLDNNREKSIELKNYKWFPHSRLTRHVRAAINHGGVGLLVKENILNDFNLSVLDMSLDGLLSVEFTHKQSEFNFVVLICYVPPEGSPWSQNISDFYAYLTSEVYSNFECDMLFIVGDMNGRIGHKDETYSEDNIRARTVLDTQTNSQGLAFIECMSDLRFCILNGRFENDNFTCISHKGKSVVDYVAVPYDCLEKCSKFQVITPIDAVDDSNSRFLIGEKSKMSDHSILICEFNATFSTVNPSVNKSSEYPGRKRRYCFKDLPHDFCNSDNFKAAIQLYVTKLENLDLNQGNIDAAYKDLCELLESEMDSLLDRGSVGRQTRKRYKSHKPFWDQELTTLWLDMKNKNKVFNKSKKLAHSKDQCYQDFKQAQHVFDRTLRRKERKFKREQLEKLDEVCTSNPRQFWEDLNKLGSRKSSSVPEKARKPDGSLTTDIDDTLDIWKADFETLFSRPGYDRNDPEYVALISELNAKENEVKSDLYQPDNELMYDFLNEHILLAEIQKAIDKLKTGKSTGIDSIPNEVLKCQSLLNVLHSFFNTLSLKRNAP